MSVTLIHPVRKAREIGAEHGKSAASWLEFDDTASAARFYNMCEDGDPRIDEYRPNSPLSGEYADDYSMAELLRDCGVPDFIEFNGTDVQFDSLMDEIASAYEDAFFQSWEWKAQQAAGIYGDIICGTCGSGFINGMCDHS